MVHRGRCEAEKATVTDANGWYEIPGAEVTFGRTWLFELQQKIFPLPLPAVGKFDAGILLYKAGYIPDLRPENNVPDDPRVEIPPVHMRAEPPDSEALNRYDWALLNNLTCAFHGATSVPVQHHLHIVGQTITNPDLHFVGQPITDADKDPEPVLLCEGQPVASGSTAPTRTTRSS